MPGAIPSSSGGFCYCQHAELLGSNGKDGIIAVQRFPWITISFIQRPNIRLLFNWHLTVDYDTYFYRKLLMSGSLTSTESITLALRTSRSSNNKDEYAMIIFNSLFLPENFNLQEKYKKGSVMIFRKKL